MKSDSKDQLIGAYIRDFSETESIISYAQALSSIFGKGIILLYISDRSLDSLSMNEAEEQLRQLKKSFQSEHLVSYIAVSGNSREIITALPEKLGIICFVTALSKTADLRSTRKLLKQFSDSRAAYCVVFRPLKDPQLLKKVVFAVDFTKESKEKVLWVSYFGRFFQSEIYCLHYCYQDEFLKKKSQNNCAFVSKILSSFHLRFFFQEIEQGRKWSLDEDAQAQAVSLKAGLYITLASEAKDILHFIFGSPEEKILKRSKEIPVLFLNKRKDLYILCD